ncbi:uncharacterized protein V1518DRAFT_383804 [Limtongia smithiae]|uniref:uncharacterized protein n=1 Tax=Limtongia smithiae TaxID=1125753 RepID=UPI0034CF02E2
MLSAMTQPPGPPPVTPAQQQSHTQQQPHQQQLQSGSSVGASAQGKHICQQCHQQFTRHHNLKSHLLTHSHEKPFTCTTCNSKFRRLHDLKRHSKLHTGEKPYVCNKCGRKFARGDALARHGKGANGCAGRADGDNSDEDDEDDDDGSAGPGMSMPPAFSRGTPSHAPQPDYHQQKRQALPSIRTQDVQQQQQQQQQKSLYGPPPNAFSSAVDSPRLLSPMPHAYGAPQQQQQPPPPPGSHVVVHGGGPPGATGVAPPGVGPSQSPQTANMYSGFNSLMQQSAAGQGAQQAAANAFLQAPQPYLQQAQVAGVVAHANNLEDSLWSYVRGLEDRMRDMEERLQRTEGRLNFYERDVVSGKR